MFKASFCENRISAFDHKQTTILERKQSIRKSQCDQFSSYSSKLQHNYTRLPASVTVLLFTDKLPEVTVESLRTEQRWFDVRQNTLDELLSICSTNRKLSVY
jgi:hypothetical protein